MKILLFILLAFFVLGGIAVLKIYLMIRKNIIKPYKQQKKAFTQQYEGTQSSPQSNGNVIYSDSQTTVLKGEADKIQNDSSTTEYTIND